MYFVAYFANKCIVNKLFTNYLPTHQYQVVFLIGTYIVVILSYLLYKADGVAIYLIYFFCEQSTAPRRIPE